jgi:hypothetical protein
MPDAVFKEISSSRISIILVHKSCPVAHTLGPDVCIKVYSFSILVNDIPCIGSSIPPLGLQACCDGTMLRRELEALVPRRISQ